MRYRLLVVGMASLVDWPDPRQSYATDPETGARAKLRTEPFACAPANAHVVLRLAISFGLDPDR